MSDIDHAQIKAEIDGIMKGVKNIMKKIDALTPQEASDQEQMGDQGDHSNPSNDNPAEKQ